MPPPELNDEPTVTTYLGNQPVRITIDADATVWTHAFTYATTTPYTPGLVANGYWTISGTPTVTPLAEPRTPEETARWEEEMRRAEERRAQRERRLVEAQEKAKQTFLRLLTPEQLADHDAKAWIKVKGSKGNTYRIHTDFGYSGNIELLDEKGYKDAEFCCHPTGMLGVDLEGDRGTIPWYDAFIAQKLMIETDEVEFLKTTVVNYGRRPDVGVPHEVNPDFYGYNRCICNECESRRNAW